MAANGLSVEVGLSYDALESSYTQYHQHSHVVYADDDLELLARARRKIA